MNNTNWISRRQLLCAGTTLMVAGKIGAQEWPQRVVTLVVPSPAGNPTDAMARRLQPVLAKALRQTVIVENVAGAAGTLGATKVASSTPDGHTVLVSTPSELILSPLTIQATRYQPADFRMVGLFGRIPYVLVSRPTLPQSTLAELLTMKNVPGAAPLSYGSAGPGSLIHLIGAHFGKVTGIPLLHSPYRGVPPMMQDLMGSQLDLGFLPLGGSTPGYIEQGKLRAYGITSSEPYPLFPTYTPLSGQHPSLRDFHFDVWAGFHLPRTVPDAVAQRWNRAFFEATADAEFREWARGSGTQLVPPMTTTQLDTFYASEVTRYQSLAKAVGVSQ